MTAEPKRAPKLPPRFVVRTAWVIHRLLYRLTPGRYGLGPAKPGKWGTMRLTPWAAARGGARRHPRLLRGWPEPGHAGDERLGGGEPAWWLNLQANPMRFWTCRIDRLPSVVGRPPATSERASGHGGATMATTSMATPRGARPRRRSSSWSPGIGTLARSTRPGWGPPGGARCCRPDRRTSRTTRSRRASGPAPASARSAPSGRCR